MKTASAFNTSTNTVEALKNAYADLEQKLGGTPSWMTVHCTCQHSGDVITATLEEVAPGVPFQGGTSCLGIMTEEGFHSDQGISLGLFGILDPDGIYSIGHAESKGKAYSRQAGNTAITNALTKADRKKAPTIVWITCAPGDEEAILAGVEDGLGKANIPIIGGSSADNSVEGKWYQITNNQTLYNGVVVTVMYPSRPIRYAFDNSYIPTMHKGTITKASGRTVFEINHRPAADVYNEWTMGRIDEHLDGGNILSPSTLYPLGRTTVRAQGATFYQLSHPEAVLKDRALSLFTKAESGEEIVLMESSTQDLIYRVNKVTSKALGGKTLPIAAPKSQIAGALIIYCAGCMLAVQNEMQEVANQFSKALGGQPFLGVHTFGEQGCAFLGENTHANLMMSMIIFEQ